MAMNPKLLRPRVSGFNPQQIANITAWWDASDASTITLNATTVSEWRDKTGNGRHLMQGTALNQPTYAAADLGAKATVRLGAVVTQRMDCKVGGSTDVLMDVLGNDTSKLITIFAVAKAGGDSITNKCIGECDNASGFGWYHRLSGTSFFDAGDAATARVSGALLLPVPYMLAAGQAAKLTSLSTVRSLQEAAAMRPERCELHQTCFAFAALRQTRLPTPKSSLIAAPFQRPRELQCKGIWVISGG